jgi:hypothetical protein
MFRREFLLPTSQFSCSMRIMAAGFSETLVSTFKTTRRHIPKTVILIINKQAVDRIHLAQDRVQWRAAVNAIMNLRSYRTWEISCIAERLSAFQDGLCCN